MEEGVRAVAGGRLHVHVAGRSARQPEHRLSRLEAATRQGRRAGAPVARRRHTAATVLLLIGVPERTVMSVMGWSGTAMAAPYQHVGSAVRRGVAMQVGGLL